MSNKTVKEVAADVSRNVLRKGYALQNTDIFDLVPDIADSVKIDESAVRRAVMGGQRGNSFNPLNALLGLLGFQLVRKRKSKGEYEDILVSTGMASSGMLRVDEIALDGALEKIAKSIQNLEEAHAAEKSAQTARYNELRKEYINYQEQATNRITAYQTQTENIAKRIQYLMAVRRNVSRGTADCSDLAGILSDMGMNAVWPEETPDITSLFTVLKSGDPSGVGVKPCIMSGDTIAVRGMIIELEEAGSDEKTAESDQT